MKRTTIKLLILALASVLLLALTQSAYAEPTYSVTLIAYDKTNGINEAGGEVAFSDSGKGTTISGDYGENTSRIIGVYPASDYTFTGWAKGSPTGEIVSTASPYTFTVTEAVTFYALFEKVITYPVWVGDTQVTSVNKDDILGDGKAKFDPSTITLTLNNPIITGTHSNSVIYAENVHLNLVGSANIIDDTAQTGILVVHHSLTLNGDFNVSGAAMETGIYASASIEVKGGTISAAGSSEGIRAATNNVTISGGEVTAKGVGSNGYGIFSFGNLTISGGTVTATGEKYGIYADNNATISGGTVTATGSEAGTGGGAGIYALNSVSISNGTVTAKGRVRGIHAGINLSISGGSVAAETWVANESQAIFAEDGNITISGGSVEAKTAATGIYSGGKINIENGTKKVESTAGKQAIVATTELTIGDELMIKEPEGGKLSSDNRAILNADDTTATHALIVPKEITYPVWVGSTQVTESNKDDILGDGGKAKFDPETQTLTLNNPTISGEKSGAKIYIYDNDKTYTIDGTATIDGKIMMANGWNAALVIKGNITTTDSIHSPSGNITIDGKLTVTANSGYGINSGKNITIQSGTVSVTDTTSYGDAISTQNITISDGTVTATGGKNGIHANGSVIISGGTVTAEAMKGDEGTGIFSENGEITITGGSVKAAGQAGGIYATVGDIEIANGTASVEADGDYVAIHANHGTIIIGDELMIKEPTGGKLSSDNRAILNADDTTATHALIVPKEITYPVWVAGIQATESNKDDMLGDGKVSFDPASNTLTLNGAAINTDGMHASGAAIVSESIDLTVKGSFTTSSTGYGILAVQGSGTANLTLDGVTATLTAIDTGIAAYGNITINGGTVNASGSIGGHGITIKDATVTATSNTVYPAIYATTNIDIISGTVVAKGGSVGIGSFEGNVSIQDGITSVSADGSTTAIIGTKITIGDKLMIKEPEGGKVGNAETGVEIKKADDTTATHALIVPKEKTYVLWVDVTPAGSGKLELAAEAGVWVTLIDLSFPAGEHTLTAKAEDGYVFKEWRDAEADMVLSTANPFTFTLNKDVHYTAVFEKITYAFTKGDGAVWTKGSAAGLDFTVKGSPDDTNTFANFTGIQIDGAAVAAGNYTATAGSVELTLNPAYLETLAVGSHTIKAEFKDGVASAAFTVKEQDTCTVSFDPNGGTGAMAPVTVNAGEEYTLPASGFTAPAGKEFNGWDKGIPGAKITVEEDTVITAQWKNASDVPPVVTSTPIPAITPTPIPVVTSTPIPAVTSTPIPVVTPTVAPDVTTPSPVTQPPVTPDVTQRPTTPPPMTQPPVTQPPVTRPPVSPAPYVPDDSGYNFRFAFSKLWQGDHEDSIDWVLYNPDGTVAHKKFNKKIVSETEWRYEAWFASGADYYIIENVPAGYRVRYENVGEHASETDRCYNGGTIINYKLPKTGDDANLTLWLGCVLAGLTIVSFAAYAEKRKRAHGK